VDWLESMASASLATSSASATLQREMARSFFPFFVGSLGGKAERRAQFVDGCFEVVGAHAEAEAIQDGLDMQEKFFGVDHFSSLYTRGLRIVAGLSVIGVALPTGGWRDVYRAP
jgi:hypothetical protein